ncbi:AAA family ATPase [Rhizobium sp. NTR19]|uniref:AAA family ATPase n=1 Tax=Neorhizobium turbinariae TaxID=2937795 RepID=A0ABT0IWM6_9HYPH|nr:AAA family ATPase [Neorhizobium turbinariae]MCK8782240.1 AAA family ATPase [Neorhizobium turbinariae]
MVKIEASWKGVHDWADAEEVLAVKTAVVMVIPEGAQPPPTINVALDRVVHVGEVHPAHLAAAFKTVRGAKVDAGVAAALLAHRPEVLFQALRPGRPISHALARLNALKPEVPAVEANELGIEDLPGFGSARDWALNLAADLDDWRSGRIRWTDVDCGLLLSGPPGTGKTMFASAVARTCRTKFIQASSAQWQAAGHLGDYLKAMRRSFREAAQNTPAILFIDEFDAVGDRSKFSGDNANYGVQVVNGLLEALDGADRREGVIVIAATNDPDAIDPALKRPGRLDRHVAVTLPEYDDRKKIISIHLGAELPPDVLATAARATSGFSGADLAQLAKDARKIARRGRRAISPEDVLAFVPPLLVPDIETRRVLAVHEAGHAIVGLDLAFGTIKSVVVPHHLSPRSGSMGYVEWLREPNLYRSERSYRHEIAVLLGGLAAERIILGQIHDGAGGGEDSDLARATDIATLMVASFGMGSLVYQHASTPSERMELRNSDEGIRQRVEKVMAHSLQRAEGIIKGRRHHLEILVDALIRTEVVTGEQIEEALRRG